MKKESRSYDDAKKIVDEYEKEERALLESEKKRMATGKSPLGENIHSMSVSMSVSVSVSVSASVSVC